ncbi:hypothetical protein KDK77_01655 [bacterium]|nr:hypothetical protein [bacterium]
MAFRLHPFQFGKLCGSVWGIFLFGYTWFLILHKGGHIDPSFIGFAYYRYAVTPLGSIIGLAWGFADGFLAGALFAWFYNWVKHARTP